VNALGGILEVHNLALAHAPRGALANTKYPHLAIATALGHYGAYLGCSDLQSDVYFFAGHQFLLGLDF
jgi:hypothetical protein